MFTQRPKLFLPDTLELEGELYDKRHEAARAYAASNDLNVIEVDPADAWITIVAPGRTYRELRQVGSDDMSAFLACTTLYRIHHPESSLNEARRLVAY